MVIPDSDTLTVAEYEHLIEAMVDVVNDDKDEGLDVPYEDSWMPIVSKLRNQLAQRQWED